MTIILIIILVIVTIVCWIFGTSLLVNGKNTPLAFKLKSIFYWTAVILSFIVGYYIASN